MWLRCIISQKWIGAPPILCWANFAEQVVGLFLFCGPFFRRFVSDRRVGSGIQTHESGSFGTNFRNESSSSLMQRVFFLCSFVFFASTSVKRESEFQRQNIILKYELNIIQKSHIYHPANGLKIKLYSYHSILIREIIWLHSTPNYHHHTPIQPKHSSS